MEHAVILAGGVGTRLWPLSRQKRPKQSLNLVGGATLFQHAVRRLAPLFPLERIWVVSGGEHVPLLAPQVPELPRDHYLLEPQGRGTAPAIGLAAIHLRWRDPQALMAVLTADHYIADTARFRQVLAAALEVAQRGYLVTLGIPPTAPSSAYGYIEQGEPLETAQGFPVFRVARFTEKPDRATAEQMLASGRFTWNSGMFLWRVERIMEEFARQMPALYAQLEEIAATLGTPAYEQTAERVWAQVTSQTIDYGIMEGARQVAVIPVDMGWADVGSWGSLVDLLPADEKNNRHLGENVLSLEAEGNLVYSEQRLIACVGVSDLIIVDTEDALLICHKDHEQLVKQVVEQLRQRKRLDLL